MNVAQQQRMLLEIGSLKRVQKMGIAIQNTKGQVCDRAAMKYNGSKELVENVLR